MPSIGKGKKIMNAALSKRMASQGQVVQPLGICEGCPALRLVSEV